MRNVKMNLYEVGDIFLTMSNESPALRFVGTWELIAKGRTLVGVDPNDTDFNVVEKTGGEKTHTLTVDEMPSHQHNRINITGIPLTFNAPSGNQSIKLSGSGNGTVDNNLYTNSVGGGQAHNNLQPYLTCYIWCRTA